MLERLSQVFGLSLALAALATAPGCGATHDHAGKSSSARGGTSGGHGGAGASSAGTGGRGSGGVATGGTGGASDAHAGASGSNSGSGGTSAGGNGPAEAGAAGESAAGTSAAGTSAAGTSAAGTSAAGTTASGGSGGTGGVSETGGGWYGDAGADYGGASNLDNAAIPTVDESALPAPTAKAGFIELEPVSYSTLLSATPGSHTSVRTRLFYNILPADTDAKSKPVFVVFNGGPGYASSILRSFGTGHETLDGAHPDADRVENATSLTALGNLLYIDARQAGYSYSLAADPSNDAERAAGFDGQSFNEALDAGDFVRVVLRVLEEEVALRNNPVVIVGESYGGIRTPLMLYCLQHPELLRQSTNIYYDPALADEIYAHAHNVFLTSNDAALDAQTLAGQFGWQFLLEPLVAGSLQFKAENDMLADVRAGLAFELGVSAEEIAGRCSDDVTRTDAQCEAIEAAADRVSVDPADFTAFTGVAPSAVPKLSAAERTGAYRFAALPADSDPNSLELGALPTWDRYYLRAVGSTTGNPFSDLTTQGAYAAVFLVSLEHTYTLVTNGHYDTNVIGESIVPALRAYMSSSPSSGLAEVSYEGADPDVPSAVIRVRFDRYGLWAGPGTARVRFAPFPKSGHFVSVNEPERLAATLADFLTESGL